MKTIALLVGLGLISTAVQAQEAPSYVGNYDAAVMNSLNGSRSSTATAPTFEASRSAHAMSADTIGFEWSVGGLKSPIDAHNARENYGGR